MCPAVPMHASSTFPIFTLPVTSCEQRWGGRQRLGFDDTKTVRFWASGGPLRFWASDSSLWGGLFHARVRAKRERSKRSERLLTESRDGGGCAGACVDDAPRYNPDAQNLKHKIRNPKHETRNPKPEPGINQTPKT